MKSWVKLKQKTPKTKTNLAPHPPKKPNHKKPRERKTMCMQLFLVPCTVQSKAAHRSLMSCKLLAVPAVEAWREKTRLWIEWQVGYCRERPGRQMYQKASTATLHTTLSEESCQVYWKWCWRHERLEQNVPLLGRTTAQLRYPRMKSYTMWLMLYLALGAANLML